MPAKRTTKDQTVFLNRRKVNLLYSARQVGFKISTQRQEIYINALELQHWATHKINKHAHNLINDYGYKVRIINQ